MSEFNFSKIMLNFDIFLDYAKINRFLCPYFSIIKKLNSILCKVLIFFNSYLHINVNSHFFKSSVYYFYFIFYYIFNYSTTILLID